MTNEQKQFIESIAQAAKHYAKFYGIKVISPIIAQAILESGWGKSGLAKYHNYFGLKCGSSWKGKSVNMATKEEYQVGTLTDIRANFRVFDSLDDGVKGYFEFINVSRYANLKGVSDPRKYLENIKADGYATSSTYVANNMRIIEQYNLTSYDTNVSASVPPSTTKKSVEELAKEVLSGKWGNGAERKKKLEAAGYNYSEVQSKVNELSSKKTTSATNELVEKLAKEVLSGKWGNGAERKRRLTQAGYDYSVVQKRVNELSKK